MSTERINSSPILSSNSSSTSRAQEPVLSSSQKPVVPVSLQSTVTLDGQHYEVVKLISSSGEAEVFLVRNQGRDAVLKYYFSNYKPKDEIIRRLQALTRADVMVPQVTGLYQDRFYELLEYMQGGTLDAVMPLKNLALLKKYLRGIAEALNACHNAGIIHRDIKPVNIFFKTADREQVVIGDFGIASPLQEGSDYRFTTSVNRTTAYAAPELFTNINNQTTLDTKVDYYALGISLLELWLGHDPFRDFPEFMAMRIKIEGRISIPQEMDPQWRNLVKGLLTTEPPKRWGYTEVMRWLNGEQVAVFENTANSSFRPYEWDRMNNVVVDSPAALATYMENDRSKAGRQLYSRAIPDWIKQTSPDLFSELIYIIEREYPNNSQQNIDAGVTKAIYTMDRERPLKVFDGTACQSTKELASHLEKYADRYQKELQQPEAGFYLFMETRGFTDRVNLYRTFFKEYTPEKALNLVVLDLREHKLQVRGQVFENVKQLMTAGNEVLNEVLREALNRNSQFSLWIEISFSHLLENLGNWRADPDRRQSLTTLGYALGTSGLVIEGEEVNTVEQFEDLLKKNVQLFTRHAKAAENRTAADYWLSNYQYESLEQVVFPFLVHEAVDYLDFKDLYSLLMGYMGMGTSLFMTGELAEKIEGHIRANPVAAEALSEITAAGAKQFLEESEGDFVYRIESIEALLEPLAAAQKLPPGFTLLLFKKLDSTIQAYIDQDLRQVSGNSESYAEWRMKLEKLMKNDLSSINPDAPALKHWEMEEKAIAATTAEIHRKHLRELESDQQKIHKEFAAHVGDQLNLSIDYIAQFKQFSGLLLVVISGYVFYAIFSISASIHADTTMNKSDQNAVTISGIVFVLFLCCYAYLATRKHGPKPNSIIGKALFRPVFKQMKKRKEQEAMAQGNTLMQAELDKAVQKHQGAEQDEIFEESLRISLLGDQELRSLNHR